MATQALPPPERSNRPHPQPPPLIRGLRDSCHRPSGTRPGMVVLGLGVVSEDHAVHREAPEGGLPRAAVCCRPEHVDRFGDRDPVRAVSLRGTPISRPLPSTARRPHAPTGRTPTNMALRCGADLTYPSPSRAAYSVKMPPANASPVPATMATQLTEPGPGIRSIVPSGPSKTRRARSRFSPGLIRC
jgi:hypothetical protein